MSVDAGVSFQRFAAYIAEGLELDVEALEPDASLEDDLGLDSLDLIEVLTRVEELGVRLPDEVAMDVRTVGDLYREYSARAGESSPAS